MESDNAAKTTAAEERPQSLASVVSQLESQIDRLEKKAGRILSVINGEGQCEEDCPQDRPDAGYIWRLMRMEAAADVTRQHLEDILRKLTGGE
jgi:hypothetical protein